MMRLSYIDPGTGFVIFSVGGGVLAFITAVFGFIALFFKKIINFIRYYKKTVAVGVLLSGFLMTGFFFMKSKNAELNRKIIILGMDGLSPNIVESLMGEGRLSNFSRLKSQGAYRRLNTTNPPQSPVAWAAFATGKNPGKTGMFDFILRNPADYSLRLSLSNIEKGKGRPIIKEKRFWNYTSDLGIPTVIIRCPLTFPPDEVYGRMLSGMGVPDILGTEGTFTFYTSEILDKRNYIGGKVFQVPTSRLMQMNFIGPKKALLGGKTEHVKEPFEVVIKDAQSVHVLYKGQKFELTIGEWSDWKEVTFNLGFMKKMKGIVKFYLVSVEPDFNLYISPINFHPKDPFFQISYPKDYSKTLAEHIGLFYTQGMPIDTWAVNEGRLGEEASLKQTNAVLDETVKIMNTELDRLENGLLFFYFGAPDTIQHLFWQYIDPKHPLYDKDPTRGSTPEKYKKTIDEWYEKMDQILGNVMAILRKGDRLIVLSDHGFGTFRRAVHLNSWLRRNGYLELKDKDALSGQELLTDIEWSKTRAYALGFGGIYLNQKGREKEGIVNTGDESETLKKEISEKLEQWIDEKYHERMVSKVYVNEDIFHGEHAKEAPDIYVGFREGYRASWQTAMGGVPADLIEDNLKKWSGCHLFDPELVPGVLFINKPINRESVSIYDLAPTILKEVGMDEDQLKKLDLDGKPLY